MPRDQDELLAVEEGERRRPVSLGRDAHARGENLRGSFSAHQRHRLFRVDPDARGPNRPISPAEEQAAILPNDGQSYDRREGA